MSATRTICVATALIEVPHLRTVFTGRLLSETRVGPYHPVVPTVGDIRGAGEVLS